ncbi:SDR family oxidoreductase [Pannonibacter sp. I15F10I1]|uniref:SDR family oxidoreductase n=1 Tax=Pannonibacter sp. I15F10I1 TaxID=2003580 RepID=UPI001FCB08EB|nr:SDR family oxidoreductase [Pannonibacter sp. I15F10I1]
MGKVWLVTGASRGLGREITRAALDEGETVVATARYADAVREACGGEQDRLHTLALDITGAEAAKSVAAETIERFGAIDVLVNNAGYAELGFFETFIDAEVRRQFEVNLFGTMNVARAVAPHMRARRSGLIVTISSVSGLVSNAGGAVYSASKFAVEGWMEGFAQELAPLGVRSLLVEPGMLRTGSTRSERTASRRALAASAFRTMPRRSRVIVRSLTEPTATSRAIRSSSPRGSLRLHRRPSRHRGSYSAATSGSGLARRSTNCGRRSPSPPIAADTADQGRQGSDWPAPAVASGASQERTSIRATRARPEHARNGVGFLKTCPRLPFPEVAIGWSNASVSRRTKHRYGEDTGGPGRLR